MQNAIKDEIRRLEADWPRWMIWVVPVYIGPDTWCARRWDDEKRVLNAISPQDLTEQLAEAEANPACPECSGTGFVPAGRSTPVRCQVCAGTR